MATRRELVEAVEARYRSAGRHEKKEILDDEFVGVTGFHRKHAIRALKKSPRQRTGEPRQRARIYNEAVREALTHLRLDARKVDRGKLRPQSGVDRHCFRLDGSYRDGGPRTNAGD